MDFSDPRSARRRGTAASRCPSAASEQRVVLAAAPAARQRVRGARPAHRRRSGVEPPAEPMRRTPSTSRCPGPRAALGTAIASTTAPRRLRRCASTPTKRSFTSGASRRSRARRAARRARARGRPAPRGPRPLWRGAAPGPPGRRAACRTPSSRAWRRLRLGRAATQRVDADLAARHGYAGLLVPSLDVPRVPLHPYRERYREAQMHGPLPQRPPGRRARRVYDVQRAGRLRRRPRDSSRATRCDACSGAILRQDPALVARPAAGSPGEAAAPRPRPGRRRCAAASRSQARPSPFWPLPEGARSTARAAHGGRPAGRTVRRAAVQTASTASLTGGAAAAIAAASRHRPPRRRRSPPATAKRSRSRCPRRGPRWRSSTSRTGRVLGRVPMPEGVTTGGSSLPRRRRGVVLAGHRRRPARGDRRALPPRRADGDAGYPARQPRGRRRLGLGHGRQRRGRAADRSRLPAGADRDPPAVRRRGPSRLECTGGGRPRRGLGRARRCARDAHRPGERPRRGEHRPAGASAVAVGEGAVWAVSGERGRRSYASIRRPTPWSRGRISSRTSAAWPSPAATSGP